MGLIKRLLRGLWRRFQGKKTYQMLFQKLHAIALEGMNYGRGDQVETSGERSILRHIQTSLANENDNVVLFDVGANIGNYTSALLEVFARPGIRIHAFEPSAVTFERLVDRFRDDPRVNPHRFGFSDRSATQNLYADQPLSGLGSLYQRRLEHRNIVLGRSESVELTTIDDFCREHAIVHIHFLKLDVEGHELQVLEGGRGMLAGGKISFIQWEFGGCNIDSRTYFRDFYYLLNERFRLYRIVRDGLVEIPRYDETLEIFTTANYLAELRSWPALSETGGLI